MPLYLWHSTRTSFFRTRIICTTGSANSSDGVKRQRKQSVGRDGISSRHVAVREPARRRAGRISRSKPLCRQRCRMGLRKLDGQFLLCFPALEHSWLKTRTEFAPHVSQERCLELHRLGAVIAASGFGRDRLCVTAGTKRGPNAHTGPWFRHGTGGVVARKKGQCAGVVGQAGI